MGCARVGSEEPVRDAAAAALVLPGDSRQMDCPAVGVNFYEKVFGWNIRRLDSTHPSFDDATGERQRIVVSRPGNLSRTAGAAAVHLGRQHRCDAVKGCAHGGGVVEEPHLDSPGACWIATFRDSAGNVIGLYQEGRR